MSERPDPAELPVRDEAYVRKPLDDGYRLEVFSGSDSVTATDVIELWVSEGVLPEAQARRRVDEVLVVGCHEGTGVVGVCTAYLQRNKQLGMDVWYFRVFTAMDHRGSNVMRAMALQAFEMLEERHRCGRDTRGSGIAGEAENQGLRTYYPEAETVMGMRYIGDNERGDQVRVYYFDDAEVPVTKPAQRREA